MANPQFADLSKAPEVRCPAVHAVVACSPADHASAALLKLTCAALGPQVGQIHAVSHPSSIGASAYNDGASAALASLGPPSKASGLLLPRHYKNEELEKQKIVTASSCDYLLFCQAGVLPGLHAVSIMKAILDSDPGVGVVGPVTDGPAGLQQVAAPGQHYRTDQGFLLFADYVAMLHRASHRPAPRVDSFFLLTTVDVFLRAGRFDPQFDPACFEDDDFCNAVATATNLLPAVAYGAWVGWPVVQRPPAANSEAVYEVNKSKYEAKWSSLVRPAANARRVIN